MLIQTVNKLKKLRGGNWVPKALAVAQPSIKRKIKLL
jgi:hypothetical protein